MKKHVRVIQNNENEGAKGHRISQRSGTSSDITSASLKPATERSVGTVATTIVMHREPGCGRVQ